MADIDMAGLVAPVSEHLVPLLQEGLEACVERHRTGEGRGADSYSFGTDAWSFPAKLFRDGIDEMPFDLVPGAGCVLLKDGVCIHHHRVGESEADDIRVSFPTGAKGLKNKLERQGELFHDARHIEPRSIVLAYMANAEDGLCAVYLGRVGGVVRGKIVEWAETEMVWRRDLTTGEVRPAAPPAPEPVQDPVVRRNSKRAQNDVE